MIDQTIPEDIRKLSRERAVEFYRTVKKPKPATIEPGQIWSTHTVIELPTGHRFETNDPRLIVVLEGARRPSTVWDQIKVGPISYLISMATEYDQICTRKETPLSFDFICEVWNETPVIKKHLREYLGKLSELATTALLDLYKYYLADEEVPISLANWVGPRLMGDKDPRFAFQEAEVEAVEYLARAATSALSLELASTELAQANNQASEENHFSALPMLRRLVDAFQRPTTAYAAGLDLEKTWVVSVSEENDYLTFELLNSRTPPYDVYLVAHEISPTLMGRQCIVTVKTAGRELKSDPKNLGTGSEFRVGEAHPFKPDQVQSIEITVQ